MYNTCRGGHLKSCTSLNFCSAQGSTCTVIANLQAEDYTLCMVEFDAIDRTILTVLQQDSSLSLADIGKTVGLSPAAVHERIKKMQRKQVIRNFRIAVNPEAIGLNLTAFVEISLDPNSGSQKVLPELEPIAEIEEMYSVAGEVDLVLKIRTRNTATLEELVYRLKNIKGVAKTTSRIVLATKLEGRVLLPPE